MTIAMCECVGRIFEQDVDPAMVGEGWLDPRDPSLGYTGWFFSIKYKEDVLGEAGPFRYKEHAAVAFDKYKQYLLDTKQIEE